METCIHLNIVPSRHAKHVVTSSLQHSWKFKLSRAGLQSCNRGLGKYISRRVVIILSRSGLGLRSGIHVAKYTAPLRTIFPTIVLTDGPCLYYVLYYVDRRTISPWDDVDIVSNREINCETNAGNKATRRKDSWRLYIGLIATENRTCPLTNCSNTIECKLERAFRTSSHASSFVSTKTCWKIISISPLVKR